MLVVGQQALHQQSSFVWTRIREERFQFVSRRQQANHIEPGPAGEEPVVDYGPGEVGGLHGAGLGMRVVGLKVGFQDLVNWAGLARRGDLQPG